MDLKKKARITRCSRCRNHGLLAEFRGHAGKCLFAACTCWKCSLVTERTRILATQRRISRTETTENPGTGPTTHARTRTGPKTPARTGTGPGTPLRPGTGSGTTARPMTDPRTPSSTGTDIRTPARTGTGPTRPDGIADRGKNNSYTCVQYSLPFNKCSFYRMSCKTQVGVKHGIKIFYQSLKETLVLVT